MCSNGLTSPTRAREGTETVHDRQPGVGGGIGTQGLTHAQLNTREIEFRPHKYHADAYRGNGTMAWRMLCRNREIEPIDLPQAWKTRAGKMVFRALRIRALKAPCTHYRKYNLEL